MWHQRDPDEFIEGEAGFPDDLVCLGEARRIDYASDKWHDDGTVERYFHHFDSHPAIYGSAARWRVDGEPADLAALLGSSRGRLASTHLGEAEVILFRAIDGREIERNLPRGTLMICTADAKHPKTLMLVAPDGVGSLIVQGGSMRIEGRGIVK